MGTKVDELTGLISGDELGTEMEGLISKGDDFAVVTMDIDGLFVLNRDYGHEAAAVLISIVVLKVQ